MQYRLAVPDDAPAVADLTTLTWGDMIEAAHVAEVIAQPQHTVWLAEQQGMLAGFCVGFPTISSAGTRRWEVDLLAVHPNQRGRGTGKALVAASVRTGHERGATLQRALIAIGNIASERCFLAADFAPEEQCALWVGGPDRDAMTAPHAAHLIPLNTVTYSGIWVEDDASQAALKSAQRQAAREGRDTVGAVVPEGTPHAAKALGFTHIGMYQRWILRL